jgi:hypothetical protein
MTFKLTALLFVSSLCLASSALAQSADDKKWINQCISDNSDAKVSKAIVTSYCTCMTEKMSTNETRTVTQWEKANPESRKACEKVAGWL